MIVQINTCYGIGSTGRIMQAIGEEARKDGYEIMSICSRKKESNELVYYLQNSIEYRINNILSRLFCMEGMTSRRNTKKLVQYLEQQDIELIHLHNIHGHYLNSKVLFDYIKEKNIPVVWTLHDEWAMTGRCACTYGCEKWMKGCEVCPNLSTYPKSFSDKTHKMFGKKKECFTNVKKLTIVTPSRWLAGKVSKSYLSCYRRKVINNGINLEVFKPRNSGIREKYGITSKYVILGIAYSWGKMKGLDVFLDLEKRLSKDYKIILVGTDTELDKKLPNSIISIHRTHSQEELVEIYSAADVFVNPTRQDTFPTTNIEALACGIPVVSFAAGGSPEIFDEKTGIVVEVDDVEGLENAIKRVCTEKLFSTNACVERAKIFNQDDKFREYVELYNEVLR